MLAFLRARLGVTFFWGLPHFLETGELMGNPSVFEDPF